SLSMTLSLAQGSPRLEVQVKFDNRARDHRLRMLFPSDILCQTSAAGASFDVVAHPVHIEPVPTAAWTEDAPATFPQQGWMDVSGAARGLCVIARGLPEFEVVESQRREVAITLLRAVSYLGAANEMQSTAAGAGPHIATPEAQMQRRLTFDLALLPHRGDWAQAEVWRQALAFHNPPRAL